MPDFHALVSEKFDLPGEDPGTQHGPSV